MSPLTYDLPSRAMGADRPMLFRCLPPLQVGFAGKGETARWKVSAEPQLIVLPRLRLLDFILTDVFFVCIHLGFLFLMGRWRNTPRSIPELCSSGVNIAFLSGRKGHRTSPQCLSRAEKKRSPSGGALVLRQTKISFTAFREKESLAPIRIALICL